MLSEVILMYDIVKTAKRAGNFEILLKAAEMTGLETTLSGKGPYTFFAPTDDAFEKMSNQQLQDLLDNKKSLSRILKYHIVPGKMMSADILFAGCAETVEGDLLCSDTGQGVKIGDAQLVLGDIECTNGIIHVIDTVLIPN